MKRVLFILCIIAVFALRAKAQTNDSKLQLSLDEAKARLVEFNTEWMLDSLDQENLPRLVSGGLLARANLSNFIITRVNSIEEATITTDFRARSYALSTFLNSKIWFFCTNVGLWSRTSIMSSSSCNS